MAYQIGFEHLVDRLRKIAISFYKQYDKRFMSKYDQGINIGEPQILFF